MKWKFFLIGLAAAFALLFITGVVLMAIALMHKYWGIHFMIPVSLLATAMFAWAYYKYSRRRKEPDE